MALAVSIAIVRGTAMSQDQTGIIEGTVATNSPPMPLDYAKVKATLITARGGFSSETTTDGAGRFTIRDVPPGRYVLEVSCDGYGYRLSLFELNPTRILPVTVEPGARTQVPPIQLTAAGKVRGRVFNKDGKGVPDASVEVLRVTNDEGGRKIWKPVSNAVFTNDDGEYEHKMLAPGDYYFRATFGEGRTRVAVYYPETTERSRAAPIVLSERAERIADLRLPIAVPSEVFKLSGKVFTPAATLGKFAIIEIFLLKSSSEGFSDGSMAESTVAFRRLVYSEANTSPTSQNDIGTFEFAAVPPGRYDLIADASIEGDRYWSKVPVEVHDSEIKTAELSLNPVAELAGRVTFEGTLPGVRVSGNTISQFQRPQPGDIKLSLNRQDGLSQFTPRVIMDGGGPSFSIVDVREGDYELSATIEGNGTPPGPAHYIADIRAGGRSVFGTVFHVGIDPIESVEVIVATQGASIQGKLRGSTSPLPAAVILVPDSPRRGNASLYRVVYVPRNGEFKMNGVAPGTYKIFAVPYLNETVPYRSSEFIARHESRAVSVVVEKTTMLEGITVPYLALGR